MKKTLLKWTSIALASLTFTTTSLTAYAQEEPVAVVGEKTITKDDFYAAMKSLAGEATLRTMILEEVLVQHAENPEELEKKANEEVDQQIEEAGGEDTFQELLNYQQLGSVDEFRHQMYIRNLFENVVTQHIDTSEEAIKAFYDNEYEELMEAQHILVETEEEALAAIERLEAGEEFDALAQELSLDSTAANGGLLAPFPSGQMVPEFEEAVKGLENGTYTQEPVESQFGFHVIKAINNGTKKPYEEVKDAVKEQYIASKFADSNFSYGIIGDLIKEMNVDIKDADLKDAVKDLTEFTQEMTEEPATEEAPAEEAPAEETEEAPAEEETEEAPAEEDAE